MSLRILPFIALVALAVASCLFDGCGKNDNILTPAGPVALYTVTAKVVDTVGNPQAGAVLELDNPPNQPGTFIATTDSSGRATIQSPSGNRALIARLGITLQGTTNVNVQASSTPTDAGTIHLEPIQAPARVLAVITQAESLQTVLRAIGYSSFDTTYADSLLALSVRDSSALLTFLSQYSIVFSNCDEGLESSSNYAVLSRTYGRYISAGGKMFGGHCNFYHLQRIFPPYYQTYDNQEDEARDSLSVVDGGLASWLGYSIAGWDSSTDSRKLSGYEKFLDLPPGARVYATISWTNPQVGVIVENPLGKGKFVWTNFHNEDVLNAPGLRRIVQYFLYTM